MTISPCAMLITPMTPKVMARPMAASSSTEPSEIPYQAFCTAFQSASRFWMAAMAVAAAFTTGADGVAGQARQQPERVLIAALRITSTAASLSSSLGVVAGQNDRGARLHQRALDPRILFLGDGGLERRQRACLARLEHRLRGVVALGRVGRQQRERAERRIDGAAQPVVDAHRVDIGRRIAGDRLPGRGVGQLVGASWM